MSLIQRLNSMSDFMSLEPAEEAGCPKLSESAATNSRSGSKSDPVISQAVMPNGKRIRLLKTLLTSACERNCYYCPFRAGRDFRRATFKPEEMASVFMALQRAGLAQGIFLSSGVAGGGVRTQDQLLDTIAILRDKLNYRGYVHLKLMPGVERAQVEAAMRLADRISVNLEAPNASRLEKLAPRKEFMAELLQPLRWVAEIRRSQPAQLGWNGQWPSTTTQFVVGAVGESDLEVLSSTAALHRQVQLGRAYFSTFHPVPDTPFENLPAESPLRVDRLYQASFLIRDYGFELEELPFDSSGGLPRQIDPKLAWAGLHLAHNPVEINQADPGQLLRIPGIGPKGKDAILKARKAGRLRALDDLRRIGINPTRPAAFILLDGQRPARQLSFLNI